MANAYKMPYYPILTHDSNAARASHPWLFGVGGDLAPEDPMAEARRASCNTCLDDVRRREPCYRASAGHPNHDGARQFAEAILAALQ